MSIRWRSRRSAAMLMAAMLPLILAGCDGPPPPAPQPPARPSASMPSAKPYVPPPVDASPAATAAGTPAVGTVTPENAIHAEGTGDIPPISVEEVEPSGGSAIDDLTAFHGASGSPWDREHIVRSTPLHRAEGALVFAAGPSSLVYDGERIIDARTGKDTAAFNEPSGSLISSRALSTDGRAYVISHPLNLAASDSQTKVLEWIATRTGKVVFQNAPPVANASEVRHLQFINAGLLLTVFKSGSKNVAAVYTLNPLGQTTGPIDIGAFGEGEAAARADGTLAVFGDGAGNAAIYNLQHADTPIALSLPPQPAGARILPNWPKSLTFSPSGEEIAGIFQNHLICWDVHGTVIYDQPLPYARLESPGEHSLSWLPAGNGWFVRDRYLFLRQEKQVVWQLRYQPDGKARLLSRDELLFVWNGGLGKQDVSVITTPWELIAQALSAKQTLYRSEDAVLFNLRVGDVLFVPKSDVEKTLYDALSSRIVQAPIGSPPATTGALEVDYSEVAAPPGAKQGAVCKLRMQLIPPGGGAPIWTCDYDSNRSKVSLPGSSEQLLRAQTFQLMQLRLQQLPFPTRIPKDSSLPRLPIVSDIEKR